MQAGNIKTDSKSEDRITFQEDEAQFDWLSMLLDGYAIADQGIHKAIQREESRDRKLACRKGCATCCRTHRDIPVYPLELVGITWYATEKIKGDLRFKLKEQLKVHKEGDPCPFLMDKVCSVHAVRPLACRHFNVFNKVCEEGEDAFHTRKEDVLSPIKEYMDEAFFIMLPFYGVKDEPQRRKIIEKGAQHQLVRLLQNCAWNSLVDKMNSWELNNE